MGCAMKPSGTPARRCILAVSLLLRAVALKIDSGTVPFHLAHQQSPEYHRPAKTEAANLRRPEAPAHPLLRKGSEEQNLHGPKVSTPLPVPTVPCCIVIMCFQFIVLYTALACCRTYHELTNTPKGQFEASLRAAAQTLTYGPMLCVLFIACQMRVQSLSGGKGEPQAWVQKCMSGLSFIVLMSTLLVLVIQSITGKPIRLKDNPFDVDYTSEEVRKGYKAAFYAFTMVRYLFLFALYGGLAAVLFGICSYLPPSFQKLGAVEAPAPAIIFTMILAVVFFSTQFIVAVCRTFVEHTRMQFPQVVGMMHASTTTLEFAPVLAVLFLAAHMQAAQHDAELEEWVHNCMMICTGSLCVAALLAVIVPLTLCGTFKKNPWTNELVVETPKPTVGYIFMGLRYVCCICFIASAGGVMISILTFQSPGPETTLAVSPTLQCVVNLTCQFCFVYFLMTLMLTASEVTGGTIPIEKWGLFPAIEGARATLALAPVLSILFTATQLRAMSFQGKTGAPTSWVHDGMYLATWSLQMASGICLASGLFTRNKIDYEGNVVNKFSNWYVGLILVGIRCIAMLLLYSGMVIVIIGLITMTPESSSGMPLLHGRVQPLVS